MCILSQHRVTDELTAAALLAIEQLDRDPSYAATARQLGALLETSTPLVVPAPEPTPQQLTAATFLGHRFHDYPALLDRCIGPPLRIAREPLLGYVSAQGALAALRHNDVQAALSALFLTSLTATRLEQPALETIHHLLLETGVDGSVGLLALPARRAGTSDAELSALRRRHTARFLTTAVQLLGAFPS